MDNQLLVKCLSLGYCKQGGGVRLREGQSQEIAASSASIPGNAYTVIEKITRGMHPK